MFDHIILGTLRYARPILSWFPSSQLSSQAFLTLSTTNSQSLLKLMFIESVMPSNHSSSVVPFSSYLLVFPSIRVFSSESVLHIRWPKYWIFSFNISPSNDYSGLISFRIDWFDLLCSPRDSQESSPTPQFKSINSLALSFLYSPILISIHDYWKNHSFEQIDLCRRCLCFLICCLGWS